MRPTPRACPLGSAFPPETGDESPHSGRASGARSAGPAGGPPRAVHLLFPSLGHVLPRAGCLLPLAPASTSAVGGRQRATESGRGRGRNFADLQRGGHPEPAAAAGLAGVEGLDSGRGVGRGWAELRAALWRPWGPRPAVGTSSGRGAWDPERSTELLRASVARVAGQQGPGQQGAGGRWSHRQDEVAVRGRCPRSRSSRQAFPVFRPL